MRRVLVVDDEPAICKLLQKQFRGKYTVETVPNGAQALGAIARNRPDVILLDVHLPGLDGVNLLKAFKELAAEVPVVVITGHDDPGVEEEARGHGACGFVRKPFDLRDLEAVVAAALGKPRA